MEDNRKKFKTDLNQVIPKKRPEIDDKIKYIMWENSLNTCWLDASMALIAHNKVMKRASQVSPQSKISYIINSYAEAISIINNTEKSSIHWIDRLNLAKSKLNHVKETVLQYLAPILRYKHGDPDSAFCSLFNLLKQDPIIKGIFDATWIVVKTCIKCDHHSESTKTKPVITISRIDSFDPKCPAVLYSCKCGKRDEKMRFMFVTLPPCLIFHFEYGAGHEKPLESFVTQGREYLLTGIMTLEKGLESDINHFITWVKDPFTKEWLDCNDLNPDIIYFVDSFPDIRFEEVSFYVYESFDDLGTIRDCKVVNLKNTEEDIPCIDISDESGSENNSVSNAAKTDVNTPKKEVPSKNSQDVTFSTEMDSSQSQKEILVKNDEHIFDEKINQSSAAKNSETSCIETKDSESDKIETELVKKISSDEGKDIQNEDKNMDNKEFQDFGISDVKSSEDISDFISQTDYDDKSSFELCKVDDLTDSLYNQNEPFEEDAVSPCREEKVDTTIVSPNEEEKFENTVALPHEGKKFKNTVAVEKKNGADETDDEKNKVSLPAEDHISDLLERKPEDITKKESGTSYVKVSFPRKKYPGLPYKRQNLVINNNKPASDDAKTTSVKKSLKSVEESKTSKRNRDKECDTKSQKRPRKNQNFGQALEGLQFIENKKDATHSMHKKNPRLSLQDKSKSKSNVGKASFMQKDMVSHLILKDNKSSQEYNQESTNKDKYSSMFSATESSNKNYDDGGKVLKKFENVWSCHAPNCKCEQASPDETIEIVYNCTFAYLCKLRQVFKKANSH